MDSISSRINDICEYIKSITSLSEQEVTSLRTCIDLIHQSTPTEAAGIFSRTERLISASDDLSWLSTSLTRKKNDLLSELKKLKDPVFVSLVRQGRPSTQAIESEIRFSDDKVQVIEDSIGTVENILNYLSAIEKNIDRYIWTLRDKSQYSK
jgi:hypothetical protein